MCNCLSELENESVLETRLLIGWTRYVNPSEAWLLKHHDQWYYILQKKCAHELVLIFPFKQLQLVDRPLAGSNSLQAKIGTGLHSFFSAEWSNVECVKHFTPLHMSMSWHLMK